MHKLHSIFPLLGSITLIAVVAVLSIQHPTVLRAQTAAPTLQPLPALNELVAVAGGHGADLFAVDGTHLVAIKPGARLVVDRQSTNGEWLHVITADGDAGWAKRDNLLLFDRITLPTTSIDLTPAPTPAPTALFTTPDPATTEPATTDPATAELITTAAETDTASGGSTADATASTRASTEPTGDGAAATEALVRTGAARLNIRSGPGTAYAVVTKAASGETLSVLGRSQDQNWLYVARANSTEPIGWAATQYVALTGPVATLAVQDASVSDNSGAPAAVTVPAQQSAQASAAPVGLRGKLVFSNRNGGDIYLYHLATGAVTQLTTGLDPALSPDGTQVVFSRGGGASGIYLINVDGSNERKIFGERELLRSPKWSPDGQWIVFSRGDEFNECYLNEDTGECLRFTPFVTAGLETGKDHIRKLARIDQNGENYRDLAVVEDAVAPDWSGGGVVYQSGAGLQITQDTPADQNRLLHFEIKRQYHQDPDWQPGGGRIVFQQRQGSHYEIFAINPDGSGLTALTRPVTTLVDQLPSNVSPAWSPDGQAIVFLSNRTDTHNAGPWRLWVMNADGSNQRPLPLDMTIDYQYELAQMVDWAP